MQDTGLGMYIADLPTQDLPAEATVVFTFYWPETARWEGTDFAVKVESSG
jgi:glucoamylase